MRFRDWLWAVFAGVLVIIGIGLLIIYLLTPVQSDLRNRVRSYKPKPHVIRTEIKPEVSEEVLKAEWLGENL